ncbi:MAG: DNA cytosine methyltransferase [Flavobacteriales bacterium]
MKKLRSEARAPRVIVLENVCGTLTSHNGKDFAAISEALSETNYRFGAIILDAAEFVPQSRPRLFIIAVREDIAIPPPLIAGSPMALRHTRTSACTQQRLSGGVITKQMALVER